MIEEMLAAFEKVREGLPLLAPRAGRVQAPARS
jgi:hypothetical protein